jgi:hypothetical protein
MPVNFQEVQQRVKQIGQMAPAAQKLIADRLHLAVTLLAEKAHSLEELEALRERATNLNPGLRCARPGSEALTYRATAPLLDTPIVLLAADGSQINPDRHDQIEFGVINTGAFRLQPGSHEPPREIIRTELLYGDELRSGAGQVTEEIVAMRRDSAERILLAELAAAETLPVVTLTDGQLELYREPAQTQEFTELFARYKEALRELARLGTVTAGFVDKPRADILIRLLELVILAGQGDLSQAGHLRPLLGVTDISLFRDLLQPGERSAVFGIQSRSAQNFENELALHFFYLNVGRPERPWVARVEIPAWVASSSALLDRLHSTLVDQCLQLGSRPYPYALHRAHEVAVVRLEEKDQLENMIILEFLRQGIDVGEQSNKQYTKDISGNRTRYP